MRGITTDYYKEEKKSGKKYWAICYTKSKSMSTYCGRVFFTEPSKSMAHTNNFLDKEKRMNWKLGIL